MIPSSENVRGGGDYVMIEYRQTVSIVNNRLSDLGGISLSRNLSYVSRSGAHLMTENGHCSRHGDGGASSIVSSPSRLQNSDSRNLNGHFPRGYVGSGNSLNASCHTTRILNENESNACEISFHDHCGLSVLIDHCHSDAYSVCVCV